MAIVENINTTFKNHKDDFINAFKAGNPDALDEPLNSLKSDLKEFINSDSTINPNEEKLHELVSFYSSKLRAFTEDRDEPQFNRYYEWFCDDFSKGLTQN
ncbi:TPA: hypothetical protein U2D29_002236 [Streptococcus suis]|uniref:hypothetical protein n=1 Tax=Streptococcus suis TaxID=1307 RepID=UPI001555444A|nr:hypothetical protein [Streptococcus suis]NQL53278.1 hypothetical protein [Streptococcus suis]NQM23677.1 hypothetical protein [Streptococcus suis]HEL2460300.1 hypothetical protein [Streptococcus suis]HEM4066436.1 hypothetical protein [Streptococcus suis]HEM4275167.1 hypothetical protein [Streptococcus suis]